MSGPADRRPQRVAAVLDQESPDVTDILAALALVPAMRAELDATERALVDAARTAGASWNNIADAQGLASRQAAEQRRLRLDDTLYGRDVVAARRRTSRQRTVDTATGPAVVALRAAVAALRSAIDRTPDWDTFGPAAALARQTTQMAGDADPGALVDLARLVVGDLTGPGITKPLKRSTLDLVGKLGLMVSTRA